VVKMMNTEEYRKFYEMIEEKNNELRLVIQALTNASETIKSNMGSDAISCKYANELSEKCTSLTNLAESIDKLILGLKKEYLDAQDILRNL